MLCVSVIRWGGAAAETAAWGVEGWGHGELGTGLPFDLHEEQPLLGQIASTARATAAIGTDTSTLMALDQYLRRRTASRDQPAFTRDYPVRLASYDGL